MPGGWLSSAIQGTVLALLTHSAVAADDNPLVVPGANSGYSLAECIQSAATFYGVSDLLIYVVAMQESGMDPYALNSNSEDIGIMQINSRWLPTLKQKAGITRNDLFDPCVNIHVGAWVLRGNMNRYGPTWRAVGAYNASARRPDLRERYARKIRKALSKIVGTDT